MISEDFIKQHGLTLKAWASSSGTETFIQLLELKKEELTQAISQISCNKLGQTKEHEEEGIQIIKNIVGTIKSINSLIYTINELKIYSL